MENKKPTWAKGKLEALVGAAVLSSRLWTGHGFSNPAPKKLWLGTRILLPQPPPSSLQPQKFPPWGGLASCRLSGLDRRVTFHQLYWKAFRGTGYIHSAGLSFCATGLLAGLLALSTLLLPALPPDTAPLRVPLLLLFPRSSATEMYLLQLALGRSTGVLGMSLWQPPLPL